MSLEKLSAWSGLQKPSPTWDDERLVRACVAGDGDAWEALLQKYKRLIYAVPFRYGAEEGDAADIFQLVCLDLYQELPRLRKVDSLRSWLITVAGRHSLKWKHKRARQSGEDVDLNLHADPEAGAYAEALTAVERTQMVTEAIGRLSPRCATLIRRLFLDDPPMPYDELARELGLATGSIGFNRGRCLEKLRKTLEEMGL